MRISVLTTILSCSLLGVFLSVGSDGQAAIFRCTDGHYEAGTWASEKFNRYQSQWCNSEPVLGLNEIPEGIYDCDKGAAQDGALAGYYNFKRDKKNGGEILTNLAVSTAKAGKNPDAARITEFVPGYTQVNGTLNIGDGSIDKGSIDQGPHAYGDVRRLTEAIRILKNKQGSFAGLAVEQAKLEYTDPFGWSWTRTAYLSCHLRRPAIPGMAKGSPLKPIESPAKSRQRAS